MKRRLLRCLTAGVLLLSPTVPTLRAQVVNDGATNILNNGTHNFTGDVTVGTNGPSTLLILTNAAWLTNSGHGYVGRNPGANINTVRLAGPDTRWRMSGDLFAGRDGAGNQLLVSNDSVVRSRDGYVGYGVTSSGNLALVTGEGSFWTNVATLYVGFQGAGNQLVLSNNAAAGSTSGYLGYFSTGNAAVVTGTNSLWANALEFAVGYNGGANQLTVNNGGLVRDADGYLGYGSASGGNGAVVTGAGSLWKHDFDFHVGKFGAGNQLLVSNGGAVSDINGLLGSGATSSSSNVALVTGAGSLWLNGDSLYVGGVGAGNQMVVSNGAAVWCDQGYLGSGVTSSNNVALVTGAGSLWTNATFFHVGFSGTGNQLVVADGGGVWNQSGIIGVNYTSTNNIAVVTGPGSLWVNDLGLIVGYISSGNHLVVSNGGAVRDYSGYIGTWAQFSNNTALVTGTGSLWTNLADLVVGESGTHNKLVVTNGGVARNTTGTVGKNSGADFNLALVTGAGSLWTNSGNLFVGSNGAFNQLIVSAGGRARAADGYLGFTSTSSNNVAVVTGAGSLWTNQSTLDVGYHGAGNQLVVSNGGVVGSIYGYLGDGSTSYGNKAVVTGAGSRWWNESDMSVGYAGAGNQLVVSNGGLLQNNYGYVGFNATSSSNTVVVTGAGSAWTNRFDLYLAWNGSGNQVVVSNGGVMHVGRVGHISLDSTASNNMVVVTGAGSLWTTAFDLFMGADGAGNQLMVSDGGVMHVGRAGYVGTGSAAANNMAVVTGAGSLWTNAAELIVGNSGSGNQLVVSNGGVVRNTTGTVGNNIGADLNLVRVTGVGSLWTNASALFVGYFGSANQLVVNNGGKVRVAGPVTLGYADTAINNSVLATGGSLTSVGLKLGNAASRNNSVTLLSGSLWDLGGGPFIWGNAGINDTLNIDATSALTNIGGLKLDENSTAFFLTNAPGGYTLNGFSTNQFQFTSNVLGALVVGDYGTNVQLVISNYTLAGTTGTIGDNATALSNSVLVTGVGTVWSNSGPLTVGNNGSFSQLVVSNGGAVRAGGLITLGNTANSTNNRVRAVGGSLSSAGLTLGNVASRNNSITLLSGSIWDAGGGTFTWGNAGINDTLAIDGTSSLTNIGAFTLDENDTTNFLINGTSLNGLNVGFKTGGLGALVVGNAGTNVALTISNFNWAGTSGDIGLGATSRSNSVFLSGIGSTWSNSGALKIGNSGAFNQLVISNGAQARDNDGYLGFNSSSSNNEALVTGTGSLWSSRSNLVVGNFGGGNRLTISNAATVSASNHVVVGYNSGAASNSLLLSTGAGLTNGGDGILGWNPGANGNSAFISGTNSRWLVGNSLCVGTNGAFNQLVISNGGTVIAGSGLSVFTGGGVFVGANAGASNNLLLLSTGAQMTNGGNVVLGWNAGANSNTVSVSGASTRWQLLPYAYFYVGNSGAGNRLVISNGAQVKQTGNTIANIGYNFSALNNEVVVTGPNSLWTMADLTVGLHGGGSRMVVSDGARVESGAGWVGPPNAAPPGPVSNNVVLVTGANSRWSLSSGLVVGNSGSGSLVISNGGGVDNFAGIIGVHSVFGGNNAALVTGANSYWSNTVSFYVGQAGFGNRLVISNGGWVDNTSGIIGVQTTAETNEVVVTGAGSVWNNRSDLYVGNDGVGNRLLITDGGKVFVASKAYVGFGFYLVASNNLLTVSGGSLIVTNLAGSGALDVRYGTNVLNAGLIEADRLILTNASDRGGGLFIFNGGTLKTRSTTNNNGRLFAVGNGTSLSAFELVGNGLHTFNNGLAISNNATFRGNGTIGGLLAVAIGGTLSPGIPPSGIGKMVLSNSPVLQGNVIMEISRNGAVLTNDQIQVAGALTYGGSLTVSNIGPSALTAGNSFQLFNASGYAGTFSTLSLPALNAGLAWTNKLLVNGSIEVIGVTQPKFENISVSGTNVIITGTNGTPGANYAVLTATNITLPVSNWVSLLTNQFGAGGGFSFTNGIAPGEPHRYFRIRTP